VPATILASDAVILCIHSEGVPLTLLRSDGARLERDSRAMPVAVSARGSRGLARLRKRCAYTRRSPAARASSIVGSGSERRSSLHDKDPPSALSAITNYAATAVTRSPRADGVAG